MGDGKRILLVEDHPATRAIMEALLRRAGYDLVIAGDGEAALQHLQTHPVDLVITDLALPKISGLEVIKAVKQLGRCRVIAMTAHWQHSPIVTQAEELGADAVLGKPFDHRQLLDIVAQQLKSP